MAPDSVGAVIAYSNVLIPIVAIGLTLSTYLMLGSEPNGWALTLTGSGAFLIYIVEQTWWLGPEDRFNNRERIDWQRRNRLFLGTSSAICVLLFVIAVSKTRSVMMFPLVAVLGSVATVYCLPILPGRVRLKSIWFLKPILIAAAWAVGTTLLPVLFNAQAPSVSVCALGFYRFVFLLPNTLLADWPDVDGDRRAGLETIATKFVVGLPRSAGLVALTVPALATVLWICLPVSSLILVDSLVALLYLALCRTDPGTPGRYFRLQLDLLVCIPLVCATLYRVFS